MRTRSIMLAGLVAVALAGCGGGGNDAASVRQTAHEFLNDLASGNAHGACSLFTAGALTAVGGQSGCLRVLGLVTKQPGLKARIDQRSAKIDSAPVTIKGNTATLTIGSGTPTQLTKQNGKWLISGGLG